MSLFLAQLTDVRKRAKVLIGEKHVSKDSVEIISMLLKAVSTLEGQVAHCEGQSAEIRLLKSRNEAVSAECKRKGAELKAFKTKIISIVVAEVPKIRCEVLKITSACGTDIEDPKYIAARKITCALNELIQRLAKE